jgi:hypothetical protein
MPDYRPRSTAATIASALDAERPERSKIRLAAIFDMRESAGGKQKLSGAGALESRESVVAGRGFEPLTFRL